MAVDTVRLIAQIDENGRLVAQVPESLVPGTVEILLQVPSTPDADSARDWTTGVAREWADELADARQDIYSPDDGEPVDEAR